MSRLKELLDKLNEKIPFVKREKGASSIISIDGYKVVCRENNVNEALCALLSSQITIDRIEDRENFFSNLMSANFLRHGTGGGLFSLTGDENQVVLSFYIPLDISPNNFKEEIEKLINYVDYWTEQLKTLI